jgi:tryptophan 7-halogenase
MKHKVEKIAIVGGGTAGLVTALILQKKFENMSIDIIRSEKIGIIGVGEGSTEHWSDFMEFVGIDHRTLVRETDATFKSGIMFENWGKNNFLQSIGDMFNYENYGYPIVYSNLISKGALPKDLVSSMSWNSQSNIWFIGKDDQSQVQQYHFNTNKLNDFLTKICKERGIGIIDDEINEIILDDAGYINKLEGTKSNYNYDFFVDSTGFSKLLISKMGSTWKSYAEYLRMNSAIVFPIENQGEIPMWTLAKAMSAGWVFRIPVWGRYGNGYIFDDNYISQDEAKREVEQYLETDVEIKKVIKFEPGRLEKCWIKNCCAIGLSASFVEPLEASSMGTSIQQAFLLGDSLINYNEKVIDRYNNTVVDILDNIRDFLCLHYLTDRDDSRFWKDQREIKIPDRLRDQLEIWKHKIPSHADFSDLSDKILFSQLHFTLILHGLDKFNIRSIKLEYETMFTRDKKEEIEHIISQFNSQTYSTISHKNMLTVLRDLKNFPNF